MRFGTVAVVGMVVLAATTLTAEAGKYTCEFQKDGTAVNSCKIDSSNANTQVCEYGFSTNIRGLCGVQGTTSDLLLCVLATPSAIASTVMSGLPVDIAGASRALAQKPGFTAGAVTIAPANQGVIAAVYVEKQGAPSLAGVCTPQ